MLLINGNLFLLVYFTSKGKKAQYIDDRIPNFLFFQYNSPWEGDFEQNRGWFVKRYLLAVIFIITAVLNLTAQQEPINHALIPDMGHSSTITAAAFSPDGTRVVTSSHDYTLMVWDTQSGKYLFTLDTGIRWYPSVTWSPDGKDILGCSYGEIQFWSAETGNKTRKITSVRGQVNRIMYCNENKNIFYLAENTVGLIEPETGEIIVSFFISGIKVNAYSLSPDGNIIAVGGESEGNIISLWDVKNRKKLWDIAGHEGDITFLSFSPDGKTLASTSSDKTIKIWKTDSIWGFETQTFRGHQDAVRSVLWSPDGEKIITASLDNTIRVWETSTGQEITRITGHSSQVWTLELSPDKKQFLSGSADKTARLWNMDNWQQAQVFSAAAIANWCAAYSPDGKRFVTGTENGLVTVWSTETGERLFTMSSGHTSIVRTAIYSHDGSFIVTGGDDTNVSIWDARDGKIITRLTNHLGAICSAAFTSDNRYLATGDSNSTIRIWDTSSWRSIRIISSLNNTIFSLSYSPDGKLLAAGIGGKEKPFRIWETENWTELPGISEPSDTVYRLSFSPDGKTVALASFDRLVRLWDINNNQKLWQQNVNNDSVYSLSFSPDGTRIIVGDNRKTVSEISALNGSKIRSLDGHEGPVFAATYRPDGKQILSSSFDGTSRLWDFYSGRELAIFSNYLQNEWLTIVNKSYYIGSSNSSRHINIHNGRSITPFNSNTRNLRNPDYITTNLKSSFLHTAESSINNSETDVMLFPQLVLHSFSTHIALSHDGKYLCRYDSTYNSIKIIDYENGRELKRITNSGSGYISINHISFNKNNDKIITVSSSRREIRIWDVITGNEIKSVTENDFSIRSSAISRNGMYLVTGNTNGKITLWDLENAQIIKSWDAPIEDNNRAINSLAISSDNKYILSGSSDRIIRLWDIEQNSVIKTFSDQSSVINLLAFSPNGNTFVSCSDYNDASIRIWDINNGRLTRTIERRGFTITSLAFNKNGNIIAAAGSSNTIELWDTQTGRQTGTIETDRSGDITLINTDDTILCASGRNVSVWDINSRRQLRKIDEYLSGVRCISASYDGVFIASASNSSVTDDFPIYIWDVKNAKLLIQLKGHNREVQSIVFSPDNRRIFSHSFDRTIRCWEVSSGREIWRSGDYAQNVRAIALSPDGKTIAVSIQNNTVRILNAETGRELHSFESPLGATVLAISPNNELLVYNQGNSSIIVRNLQTGREQFTLSHESRHSINLIFSPNGKQLLSTADSENIIVWDLESKTIMQSFKLEFSSPSQILGYLSGTNSIIYRDSIRQEIVFYNITTGTKTGSLNLPSRVTGSVLFNNQKFIVCGISDGSVRILDLKTGIETVSFIYYSDGEWIVLTPDGYYNASEKGSDYISVQEGNNFKRITEFGNSRLRPEIIMERFIGAAR